MKEEVPEPLWREVVGDTEPWRRGRIFLILLVVWNIVSQGFMVSVGIFTGNIERVFALALGATVFWLCFYFIWIGVHWVRWLSAGFSGLIAFAKLIWGMRDGNAVYIVDGTIGFVIAAYLGLAPSVYFFAIRQKETVRWKESVGVAAAFFLLLLSFGTGMIALFGLKARLETNAREFADKTFHRVLIDSDNSFVRNHITQRLVREKGWDQLNEFMLSTKRQLGVARNLQPAEGRVQFHFQFPVTLVAVGRMSATAESDNGPLRAWVVLADAGGEWQIDAISWQYSQPVMRPRH